MNAAQKAMQDEVAFMVELTDMDYRQLRSFESMLKSSIQAAEETLATARNRHAIFLRMLERIEENNGIDKSFVESGSFSFCASDRQQKKRA